MVRDDTHQNVVVTAAAVSLAGDLLGGGNDREDLVRLVHVRLVLQQEGDALKTGAGINGSLIQIAEQRVVLSLALTT